MHRANHLASHLQLHPTAASAFASSNDSIPFHQYLFQQFEKSNDAKQKSSIVLQDTKTQPGSRYTYSDVKQESLALATALSARGVKPGNAIAIYSDHVVEYPIVVLACSIVQVKLLVIPPKTSTNELSKQLQANQAVLIFARDYCIPAIQQCRSSNKQLKRIVLFDPLRPVAASEYYRQLIVSASKPKIPQIKYNGQQDVLLITASEKLTHHDVIQQLDKQQQGQSNVILQLDRLLTERVQSQ